MLHFYKKQAHQFDFPAGELLLFDKPYRKTSFYVVKKARYFTKAKKVGHAGTLDPLATGLLIVCTGKMTKQIEHFQGQEKEYEGELVLGKHRPSIDMETEIIQEKDIGHLTEDMVRKSFEHFQGEIEQTPPVFSAIKVDGKRAYEHARKGKEVALKSRKVLINEFAPLEINLPTVRFKVVCSKGTYIRSLVKDLGEQLKVGAYLSALTRTRIGSYHLKDAYQVEEFVNLLQPNNPQNVS